MGNSGAQFLETVQSSVAIDVRILFLKNFSQINIFSRNIVTKKDALYVYEHFYINFVVIQGFRTNAFGN